jgi:hypothetical protein
MTWTAKRVGETEAFTADFAGGVTPRLGTGETITSAVWSVSVVTGVDASPSAMLSGSLAISGAKVTQMITGGVAGVVYRLICTALTSAGQTLVLPDIGRDTLAVVA